MPRHIIIDTDIGTDIDDTFAVVLAAKSREVEVKAVTTVYGDVDIRARVARKLLNLAGRDDIPVAKGLGEPLTRGMKPIVDGHEGKGVLTPSDTDLEIHKVPAVDLIVNKIQESSEGITMITIGPLTNFASAIKKEPSIVEKISEYIVMGGVIEPPIIGGKPISPRLEFNLNADPDATRIVFNAGIRSVSMVMLDVTWRVLIGQSHLQRLRAADTPLTNILANMLEIWLEKINAGKSIYGVNYPGQNVVAIHDPVAVSLAIDPRFLTLRETHIELRVIDNILRTIPNPTLKPNMKVATDVNVKGFLDFFMERVLATS